MFQYYFWVLPYHFQNKDFTDSHGFLCADEFVDNNSDLLIELQNYIVIWYTIIYDALNYKQILPDAKVILANYNG